LPKWLKIVELTLGNGYADVRAKGFLKEMETLVQSKLQVDICGCASFEMSILDKCLIEIFKDVEYTVQVKSVKLETRGYVDCFVVPGVENAGQSQSAPHRSHRKAAGNRHLIFDEKVAAYSLSAKATIVE